MGLGVKIIIGVVAIAVIAALLIPFLGNYQSSETASTSISSSPMQPNVALSAPEATAQANPNSAEAQFELGNSYYGAGQLEQAVNAYQKAIALNPNYQAAYANLGVVYYTSEQFDLAAAQYKKALELNPQDGDVAYNLGALYLQQALIPNEPPDPQLVTKAVTQLQTAMEISPDLPEPHFTLGVAYLASNQQENALQEFETFLAFDAALLDPRAVSEAERYMQLLQGQ